MYCIYSLEMCLVPLIAGWRETKLKCTFGLWGKKKNCSLIFTISKWISLLLQMFSLVLFGGTRLATLAVSDTRWPATGESQWGEEGGVSTECLSAVVLWVSGGSPTAQHFLLGPAPSPTGLAFSLAGKRLLWGWPITALRPHAASPTRARHHSTLPLSCPPPISQFFDTKITLAGRCNSHISGIFASVICFFMIIWLYFFSVFVDMQWYTRYWLLN